MTFLRTALNASARRAARTSCPRGLLRIVKEKAGFLGISQEMLRRGVNVGFSGGEKKRNEILQMALLEPKVAILDETDSGLDIDALKIVSEGVNALRSKDRAMVVITHYQRLLDHIVPDFVHVMHKAASCAPAARNWRWSSKPRAMRPTARTRREEHGHERRHPPCARPPSRRSPPPWSSSAFRASPSRAGSESCAAPPPPPSPRVVSHPPGRGMEVHRPQGDPARCRAAGRPAGCLRRGGRLLQGAHRARRQAHPVRERRARAPASDLLALESGIAALPLESAIASNDPLAERIGALQPQRYDAPLALNTVFLGEGLLVRVSAGRRSPRRCTSPMSSPATMPPPLMAAWSWWWRTAPR